MAPLAPDPVDLPVRAAYDLWAARYDVDGRNPLSDLAHVMAADLVPRAPAGCLVDLGCGTGRGLDLLEAASPGAQVIGLDLSLAMLRRAMARSSGAAVAMADMARLPLAAGSVDGALLCLSLSHAPRPEDLLAELGRAASAGSWLVVVDLHTAARERGWRRDFRAEDGRPHAVRWHAHDRGRLERAARAAGFRPLRWVEAGLDPATLPAAAPPSAAEFPALFGLLARRAGMESGA